MRESEKEEATQWLKRLLSLHEQIETAIREITSLKTESSGEDWNAAYSNKNVRELMSASLFMKELPKPKPKELRKLKKCYTDMVAACLQAGHLFLKAYEAEDLNRLTYSKMIFWTSFAGNLFKDFEKNSEKVSQELEIDK